MHLTAAINAALFQRERTGRGQWVEVDMAEALLHANDFTHWDLSSIDVGDYRPTLSPPYTPILRTGAGPSIVIAGDPAGAGIFEAYCSLLDRPELLDDPRFAPASRRSNRAALVDIIEHGRWPSKTSTSSNECSADAGFPMGVVRSTSEAATSDWARRSRRGRRGRRPRRRNGRDPAGAVAVLGRHHGTRGVPAYRGEHNREVLRELLGTDDATLDRWEAAGVLSSRLPNPG